MPQWLVLVEPSRQTTIFHFSELISNHYVAALEIRCSRVKFPKRSYHCSFINTPWAKPAWKFQSASRSDIILLRSSHHGVILTPLPTSLLTNVSEDVSVHICASPAEQRNRLNYSRIHILLHCCSVVGLDNLKRKQIVDGEFLSGGIIFFLLVPSN
ncbi:hypothetical protein D918_08798 [Trichuris suis]|nr:hypothetical protein D918_08798 [Trichuris suis]